MPVQDWTIGQMVTAAEMTSLSDMLPYVTKQTADYQALAGDLAFVDASGSSFGVQVTAPASPTAGQMYGVIKTDTVSTKAVYPDDSRSLIGQGAGYVYQYDGEDWQIVQVIPSQWTAYTPAWTDSTTDPAIGNGTLGGWFRQSDATIDLTLSMKAGSTTTFGTGTGWVFSLPIPASEAFPNPLFFGFANPAGESWIGQLYGTGGQQTAGTVVYTSISAPVAITASEPAAWGSGGIFQVQGTYIAELG